MGFFVIIILNSAILSNVFKISNSTSIEGSFEDLANRFIKLVGRMLTMLRAVVKSLT